MANEQQTQEVEVLPGELPPENQEYIDEMVKKGESAVNNGNTHASEQTPAPKPDNVPEKFYNKETGEVDYEAMAKSYSELEKKQSQGKSNSSTDDTTNKNNKGASEDEPNKEDVKDQDKNTADKAVEKAGLDMNSLRSEYQEKGELSDDTYQKLVDSGISKETVDSYIEGQKALVEKVQAEAFEIVDGQENYQAMINWASSTLSSEEQDNFNNQVASSNKGVRETAIRGLMSRFVDSEGSQGELHTGKRNNTGTVQGYASKAEMMKAMGDPRYKEDPAYREAVIRKVEKSNIF